MPKRRHRFRLDDGLLAIMTLFVLAGLSALGFLRDFSKENRALIVITSSVRALGCFIGLFLLRAFKVGLRKRVWLRTMSAWRESSQAETNSNFLLGKQLSETGLRNLAIQMYSRMGYRISNSMDKAGYIQLVNPEGENELVACKQQPELLELHPIYSLQLEMKRIKAMRGFFWAPGGFRNDAITWAVRRFIILTDQHEIGRLVDCAHINGSRFLEF